MQQQTPQQNTNVPDMQLVEQIGRLYATDSNEERQQLMDSLAALGKWIWRKLGLDLRGRLG